MKISEFNNLTIKEAAIWCYDFGANPLPIDPKSKKPLVTTWKEWQYERMPRAYFEDLCNKYFIEGNGIGLITGKLYDKNKGNYLVGVDADNFPAVEAIRTTIKGEKLALEEFTKEGINVECHNDNYNKIHLLYLMPFNKENLKQLYDRRQNDLISLAVKEEATKKAFEVKDVTGNITKSYELFRDQPFNYLFAAEYIPREIKAELRQEAVAQGFIHGTTGDFQPTKSGNSTTGKNTYQ